MYEAMQDYYNSIKLDDEENKKLLKEIKTLKGKTFYKYLLEIIKDSDGICGVAEIVDKPVGKFQSEKYGRQINGIWVNQWSVGMEGDSFNGIVCVMLEPNKYFKFNYSM